MHRLRPAIRALPILLRGCDQHLSRLPGCRSQGLLQRGCGLQGRGLLQDRFSSRLLRIIGVINTFLAGESLPSAVMRGLFGRNFRFAPRLVILTRINFIGAYLRQNI